MIGAVLVALAFTLYQAINNKSDKLKGRYGWISVGLVWWLFVLSGVLKFWMVTA